MRPSFMEIDKLRYKINCSFNANLFTFESKHYTFGVKCLAIVTKWYPKQHVLIFSGSSYIGNLAIDSPNPISAASKHTI